MKILTLTVSIAAMMLIGIFSTPGIYAAEIEKERTDDGYCKDGGANHGDTSPSEKRFKQYLNEDICELVDCINDERCEGSIRDYDEFEQTPAFISANVLMTDCFEDRHDLPDSKGKHLADYEIQKCGTGDY